jgi:hypothetical protein
VIGCGCAQRGARRHDGADEGANERPGDRSDTPKSHDGAQARVRLVAITNLTAHRNLGTGNDAERRADDRARDSPDPDVMRASIGCGNRGSLVRRLERRYRIRTERPAERRVRSLAYSGVATKRCSRNEQRDDERFHDYEN